MYRLIAAIFCLVLLSTSASSQTVSEEAKAVEGTPLS